MFKKSQRVKPKNTDAILADKMLSTGGRQIIESAGCVGVITKIRDDEGRPINFVTYEGTNGIVTQGFRDDEIEVAE